MLFKETDAMMDIGQRRLAGVSKKGFGTWFVGPSIASTHGSSEGTHGDIS